MEALRRFGWNEHFDKAWAERAASDCIPARIIADFGSVLRIVAPDERKAEVAGKLKHQLPAHLLPKVGDWVAVRPVGDDGAMIEAVLPRFSDISRRAVGDRDVQQVMAANIDVAFVIQALDHDFSPERMERYLFQLRSSNIRPVLVLNKADKVDDVSAFVARIEPLGIDYVVCSAETGDNVEALAGYLQPGRTGVLLGSSGVGKSTLTNYLLGRSAQKTSAIREADSKGRHTTTHREVFLLDTGGLLIDTPGIRELQLWGSADELEETFDDIAHLIRQCKFRNCGHGNEAGCAVRDALDDGSLERRHYENYLKMKKELAYLDTKDDPEAARLKKQAISKQLRQHYKGQRQAERFQDEH